MYLQNETYRSDLINALNVTVNIQKLYHTSIMITGATGLIGSFAADMLLYANRTKDAEIEIYLLARDEKRLKERFASSFDEKRLHFIIQDVVNPLEFDIEVDYIIHAAGDGYPAAFREHPVETMTPALFGTYQLLQYALHTRKKDVLKRFLYVSSGEVYGRLTGSRHAFKEEEYGYLDSMAVRSCYPMAKRCAETLCVSFGKEYHIPIVVARPSHTYGACTSANDNRATVQFLKQAMKGERIILYSSGMSVRSYTYVADCVSGLFTILTSGVNGEAYNIANADSRISIAEFANILARQANTDWCFETSNENQKIEQTPIEYAILDSSKLEMLGWMGSYDINKGIKNMINIKREIGH